MHREIQDEQNDELVYSIWELGDKSFHLSFSQVSSCKNCVYSLYYKYFHISIRPYRKFSYVRDKMIKSCLTLIM